MLLVVALSLTFSRIVKSYQTPGPFDPSRQGLCDFHNGIYFPATAVLRGESPYGDEYAAKYPVARQIPFFSPIILVLHAPLAILPLHVAEVCNLLLQLLLMVAITLLVAQCAGVRNRLDAVLMIGAAIVLSRGGHITLFNGYFTFQLVLATFLSIHWGSKKPMHAAVALLVVSSKPTYILPLGFLMLARGNIRALVAGACLSIAGAAVPLAYIAYHEGEGDIAAGATIVKDQIINTQEVHRSMEDESPVYSWTRLDLFAIIAKWRGEDPGDLPHLLSMIAILIVPMAVMIDRTRRGVDDGLDGLTGGIILTGMLVSLYHQSYDALLVIPTFAGLILGRLRVWQRADWRVRWLLLTTLALPSVNYLSTRFFLLRLDLDETWIRIFTSVNGVSLTIALATMCWMAIRDHGNGLKSVSNRG